MNRPHPPLTHQDVERHLAQARALQSRELARLTRRLLHLPTRVLGALRGDPEARARHV